VEPEESMTEQAKQHRNEVHLRGVLVRDPEIRYTPSGKPVANFTVLTTYEKRTEYHRCVAWETRSCEKNGEKRYVTEVIAWNLSDGTTQKNDHGIEVSDADIPF